MKNENKGSYGIIAIVAIVAIVGIVVMFMNSKVSAPTGTTDQAAYADPEEDPFYTGIAEGNVAGQAARSVAYDCVGGAYEGMGCGTSSGSGAAADCRSAGGRCRPPSK